METVTNDEKRPVIFFDVETTGKDKDTNKIRIIQLAAIKFKDTESWEVLDKMNKKFNNGDVPIDPGASAVHGLYHDDVKDCLTFHEKAPEIYEWFKDCDLGGYNNSFFDNSVLYMSFLRAGIKWDYRNLKIYDVLNLYRKHHNAKLTTVYRQFYGKDFDGAHDAWSDINATVDVYKAMKERGEDFSTEDLEFYKDNLDLIGDFKMRKNEETGEREPYYNFGAHKGKSVEEVGVSYLEWMSNTTDRFPLDTVHVAKQLIPWLQNRLKEKSNKIVNDKNWYDD